MLGELLVSEGFTVDCGWSERSPAKGLKGWRSVPYSPGRGSCHLPGGGPPSLDVMAGSPFLPDWAL